MLLLIHLLAQYYLSDMLLVDEVIFKTDNNLLTCLFPLKHFKMFIS